MLTSIAGRSVIVTGASKGIGKGIATVFCRNGGKVLIVSRNLADAEACAEELRRDGGTAMALAADVTSLDGMRKVADTAASAHGGIDILCANAGIYPQARIEELSPDDWDRVFATNLKGTFLAIKACLPHLKQSGGEVLFFGKGGEFLIGPSDERWDAAMLVRQTSVASFLEFASNQEYLSGIGHRLAAHARSWGVVG